MKRNAKEAIGHPFCTQLSTECHGGVMALLLLAQEVLGSNVGPMADNPG
jgi:hypothetical protein